MNDFPLRLRSIISIGQSKLARQTTFCVNKVSLFILWKPEIGEIDDLEFKKTGLGKAKVSIID